MLPFRVRSLNSQGRSRRKSAPSSNKPKLLCCPESIPHSPAHCRELPYWIIHGAQGSNCPRRRTPPHRQAAQIIVAEIVSQTRLPEGLQPESLPQLQPIFQSRNQAQGRDLARKPTVDRVIRIEADVSDRERQKEPQPGLLSTRLPQCQSEPSHTRLATPSTPTNNECRWFQAPPASPPRRPPPAHGMR